jgi:uncharacterized membrane protein
MHNFFIYSIIIIILHHDPLHVSSIACSSSGGHCIFAASGILTLCVLEYVAPIKSGLSPLLIGATYGSIQSVRIPEAANIQCPLEDEHVMLETCRGSSYNIIIE